MDPLFELSHHYYLGDYHEAIKEAGYLTLDGVDLISSRDMYLCRSLLALGRYEDVYAKISDDPMHVLYPWRVLTKYLQAQSKMDKANMEDAMKMVTAWLSEDFSIHKSLVASMILSLEELYDDVLKEIDRAKKNSETELISVRLELLSIKAQVLLYMNRLDHARKVLEDMNNIDDEHVLSKLCSIYIGMHGDKDEIEEAVYTVKELKSQFSATPMVSNALAVCEMRKGNFASAERILSEAIKKHGDIADLLVNLFTCINQVGKDSSNLLPRIVKLPVTNSWLKKFNECEEVFKSSSMSAPPS